MREGNITLDPIIKKGIWWNHFVPKLHNLCGTGKFFERYKLPKFNEEKNKLNNFITIKEIEFIVQKFLF